MAAAPMMHTTVTVPVVGATTVSAADGSVDAVAAAVPAAFVVAVTYASVLPLFFLPL
jgi:hypothetical protein